MTRLNRRALLAAGAALPLVAVRTRPARAADFSYKFANNLPLTHPLNIRAQEAVGRIKEKTGGRVDIQIFPNNQLGSDTDTLSQLRSGAVEMFTLSGLILSTLVPAAAINGVGFAFKDYAQVWPAMDGALGTFVRGEIDKRGLYAFAKQWDNGYRQITSSAKPINTPGDLAGFKIRVPPAPLWTGLFQAFGASPTSINFNEVYSALQTHVVDGQENPLAVIDTAKLYEVQKYLAVTNHMWDGFWFLVNRRAWDALPADARPIVEAELNASALAERDDVAKLNATLQASLQSHGMIFNTTDAAAFRAALKKAGFYSEWQQKFGKEAWGALEGAVGSLGLTIPRMAADPARGIARIETVLRHAAELPAAALVLLEIFVLLAGVVSRFVFRHPFVWSDELASILFLWLAMFGAVVALQRQQHMRLTAIAAAMQGGWRLRAELLAVAVPTLFLLIVLPPARDYAADQGFILTPALSLPDVLRAAAIPVGCTIMLLSCALRLARFPPREVLAMALLLAAIAFLLFLASPALKAIGNWNLAFFFVLLLAVAVLLGVPIGFAFGTATLAFLACVTRVPLSIVVSRMDEGMSSLVLLAVPLFVFLGLLIEMTGMARAMVAFLAGLLGHIKGGLYYVLLGAIYLVSGISGSKAADMAAVAPVLFPEMKARGASEGELVAILAASGAMSETIPPSLVLITIGSVTGVSIAALFTGGLLPGLVLALALAAVAWRRSRGEIVGQRAGAEQIARLLVVALPALLLPFVIRFAVIRGVATATEVSTIGIAYAAIVGLLVYRQFDWRRIYPMLVDTAGLSGAILLIIGTATGMAWALTQSGFSHQLVQAMAGVPGGRTGFLLISIVVFVVLGSVLEGIPAIVLFGPLLFPIARLVGVNEVHYAMVVILAMGIGLFAPPLGVGYYTACAIGLVSPDAGMRRIWPYLGALLVGLLAVAAIPWLSTGFL